MTILIWVFVGIMCLVWLVCLPIYLIKKICIGTANVCKQIGNRIQIRKLNKR